MHLIFNFYLNTFMKLFIIKGILHQLMTFSTSSFSLVNYQEELRKAAMKDSPTKQKIGDVLKTSSPSKFN